MQLNGNTIGFLVWAAGGLLSLASVLISIVWRLHVKSDDSYQQRTDAEINKLRTRLHNAENTASECATRLRWMDEDRRKDQEGQPRDKERRRK